MSRWTPEQSALLSLLLDDVTGTKEVVATRQDFCQLHDCLQSNIMKRSKTYFTGSKAEGLDLPGSDNDYMFDINDIIINNIKVVQSLHESPAPSLYWVFYLCTDNTPPGFAFLRCIKPGTSPIINIAIQSVNGQLYLSSSLMAEGLFSCTKMYHLFNIPHITKTARQGPSIEHWDIFDNPSESGTDMVPSIHCAFWPKDASEWIERPRPSGWPTPHDVSSIVNFGCHLVAIGHPHSETRSLEWRISFSVAERTLVWSFNHVQIQCYALMKIILKEFIKAKCNPDNQVLCSYFIKTVLFWKYEIKGLSFWQENNLRECIKYLLIEFRQCLNEGVIRHYFFPRFNLLSVKLTAEAKIELLQLFDIIIQSDISILRECKTLKTVWSKFVSADGNQNSVIHNKHRRNFLMNDKVMKDKFSLLWSITVTNVQEYMRDILGPLPSTLMHQFYMNSSLHQLINQIGTLPCKTCLKSLLLKALSFKSVILEKHCKAINTSGLGNRDVYGLLQFTAHDKSLSFDISTCKLWCAMFLLKKKDYTSTLRIVNQVLSSIPPYALAFTCSGESDHDAQYLTEVEHLYVDKFLHSDSNAIERARETWLCDLTVWKAQTKAMPLAIQIELYFYDPTFPLLLSPFTCMYYLMFQCYHELHQYDNRDRALRQLVDVVNNDEKYWKFRYHSYNIAGHCLLVAGEIDQARDMFLLSYEFLLQRPPYDKFNSALWYLQNFC